MLNRQEKHEKGQALGWTPDEAKTYRTVTFKSSLLDQRAIIHLMPL